MHMYKKVGQEMHRKAEAEVQELLLNNARNEGKAAAAVMLSARLDEILVHAQKEGLSKAELVELMTQESIKLHNEGLSHRGFY